MRRTYLLGVTVVTMLAAGCGSDDDGADLAGAFCADLRSGMTATQIIAGAGPIVDDPTPERTAGRVYVWVEESCPEQLETNDNLRSFLDANGIDPDE